MTRVVVVGAGLAGVSTCRELRTAGFDGEILLFDGESERPYDRPPLSKGFLVDGLSADQVALPDAGSFDELRVQFRPGTHAIGLAEGVLLTSTGVVEFDSLVIATGSRARRLPLQENITGTFSLRTLDDARRLREELSPGRKMVVIGAGFVGLEVSSAARSMGVDVTIVESAAAPLAHVLSSEVAGWLLAEHEARGVQFRFEATVEEFLSDDGHATGVRLDSGEEIPADLVLVSVGGVANVEWLVGSPVPLDAGIVCDSNLRAAPSVYAVGDVARWDHPMYGSMRAEHWSTAVDHARVVAANIIAELTGQPLRTAREVPYFWTDQYASKLQLAGWTHGADEVEVVSGAPRWEVLFRRRGDVVAALAVDRPAFVARHRRSIGTLARTGVAPGGLR